MSRPRALTIPSGGFREIAVLRLSSLGDVILTLPVVAALARACPGARITFWTKEEFADVVRHDPAIAHVRALERDARRIEDLVSMSAELEDCDLIVDLHANTRTRILTARQRAPVLRAPSFRLLRERWMRARWSRPAPAPHVLERYARALMPVAIAVEGVPHVVAGAEAEAWADAWFAEWKPSQPPIALCPGARHFTKRWPESHWIAFDRALAERGIPRLYVSVAAERRALPALDAAASGTGARWCVESLPRIAALLSRSAAAVTCDSGLMHLAAARGLRVTALFGSTAPELGFAPAGAGHVVLCRHEPCQPCTLHGRASCPKRHFRCMNDLSPETVLEAAIACCAEFPRPILPGLAP